MAGFKDFLGKAALKQDELLAKQAKRNQRLENMMQLLGGTDNAEMSLDRLMAFLKEHINAKYRHVSPVLQGLKKYMPDIEITGMCNIEVYPASDQVIGATIRIPVRWRNSGAVGLIRHWSRGGNDSMTQIIVNNQTFPLPYTGQGFTAEHVKGFVATFDVMFNHAPDYSEELAHPPPLTSSRDRFRGIHSTSVTFKNYHEVMNFIKSNWVVKRFGSGIPEAVHRNYEESARIKRFGREYKPIQDVDDITVTVAANRSDIDGKGWNISIQMGGYPAPSTTIIKSI